MKVWKMNLRFKGWFSGCMFVFGGVVGVFSPPRWNICPSNWVSFLQGLGQIPSKIFETRPGRFSSGDAFTTANTQLHHNSQEPVRCTIFIEHMVLHSSSKKHDFQTTLTQQLLSIFCPIIRLEKHALGKTLKIHFYLNTTFFLMVISCDFNRFFYQTPRSVNSWYDVTSLVFANTDAAGGLFLYRSFWSWTQISLSRECRKHRWTMLSSYKLRFPRTTVSQWPRYDTTWYNQAV